MTPTKREVTELFIEDLGTVTGGVSGNLTTLMLGEEGGGGAVTTSTGESGGHGATTFMIGEEGGSDLPIRSVITHVKGEDGGVWPTNPTSPSDNPNWPRR